jgi:hypothetical protein
MQARYYSRKQGKTMSLLKTGQWAAFVDVVESFISGVLKDDLGFLPEREVKNSGAPPDVLVKLLDVVKRYAVKRKGKNAKTSISHGPATTKSAK